MANRITDWAQNRGNPLIDELGGRSDYQLQKADQNGDAAAAYYKQLMAQGGYTPEEAAKIAGTDTNGNIPGLQDLSHLSDADRDSLSLTGDETRGIQGNPNDPLGYLHSDTIGQTMTEGGQAQDQAVDQQRQDFQGAIDPTSLRMSSRYGGDVMGAVGDTQGHLESITGSPDLDLSSGFQDKYDMSPEEQRDIVNSASRDVGDVSRANFEEAGRRMGAAGVGPMGLNALESRMSRGASSDAAAAATKARIAASEAAAGRTLSGEQLRLNAGQTKAGLQSDAAKYSGTQRLDALSDVEGKRSAGERDVSDRQMQAATTSGNNALQNKENQTATKVGAVENVADREVGAHQTAEQAAADRAKTIAQNNQGVRTGIVGENYNRGTASNNANSERAKVVADARVAQQNLGGQGLTQQQTINSNNANTAKGQQIDALSTTGNISNTAQTQPGTASKVVGGILGGLGAAASFFRYGGVADKPTNAVLGEDGPEMVVPLGGQQQNPISNIPLTDSGLRAPSGGGGWRSGLQKVGRVADGINAGMSGRPLPRYGQDTAPARGAGTAAPTSPMGAPTLVASPTKALLGANGPEAVIPMTPRPGQRMRPSVFASRYGAA